MSTSRCQECPALLVSIGAVLTLYGTRRKNAARASRRTFNPPWLGLCDGELQHWLSTGRGGYVWMQLERTETSNNTILPPTNGSKALLNRQCIPCHVAIKQWHLTEKKLLVHMRGHPSWNRFLISGRLIMAI